MSFWMGRRRRRREQRTVFVLSGGAVRGAAQVGMLREVLTAGIVPDAVVDVSPYYGHTADIVAEFGSAFDSGIVPYIVFAVLGND